MLHSYVARRINKSSGRCVLAGCGINKCRFRSLVHLSFAAATGRCRDARTHRQRASGDPLHGRRLQGRTPARLLSAEEGE